jgi:CheY-like chemotaxis protein
MTAVQEARPSRRVLVVEDEAIVAMLIEDMLRLIGLEIVGPAGTVQRALRLIDTETASLDGALLDVNLGTEPVYPVAERLRQLGVPFVFITGYGAAGVDGAFAGTPVLEKPFELDDVEAVIARCFPERPAH